MRYIVRALSWFGLVACSVFAAMPASAVVVPVTNVAGLRTAIQNAAPGHDIVLAAGTYDVDSNINCLVNGTAALPIRVRAATPRTVLIRISNPGSIAEGFKLSAAYWSFEDLDIEGVCAAHSDCEHAFHFFGNAEFAVLRNNVVRNFNAQLKSNGAFVDSVYSWPDDVLIERNVLYDTAARNTGNPVTKLDVVGGRRWIVRANTIYDFQKGGGDTVSYAAFLKGNSRDGIFERNLVRCSRFTTGGTRLGLSFGGGGTGPDSICEGGSCTPEHQNGIMRNNLIMSCNDVGIYLNEGTNSRLHNNTVYATAGIDVRYAASTADLRNNIVGGTIRDREGGTHTSSGDLSQVSVATFASWFQAPASANFALVNGASIVNLGVAVPLVPADFCANDRNDGQPDIGAFEYDPVLACDSSIGGGIADVIFADGFDGGP